jgi:hypothetical protein
MDLSYNRLVRTLGCDAPAVPVFDRGEILYDVSRLLLALSPAPSDLRVLERARGQDYQVARGPRQPRYIL